LICPDGGDGGTASQPLNMQNKGCIAQQKRTLTGIVIHPPINRAERVICSSREGVATAQ
jgi:hypothetical protein